MNRNPAAPENNRHHEGGYRSQQEFDEMLFGRGPGDPDMFTPPWEEELDAQRPADTTSETLCGGQASDTPF